MNKIQPDEIYNLAAQSHVAVSFKTPVSSTQTGTLGPLSILEPLRNFDKEVKFYQASSSEMYGGSSKEKLNDFGEVEIGVQRHGYHEYILNGNKFETKIHFRVVPVEGKDMWLAWTGYEQKPVDKDTDEGIWNIYEDKFKGLKYTK